ncbi:lectin 7-like [Ziziphus jujuba]|uniref:Lectin 7-like n=1 Tax=Ziziphus jujuba TaxID=326968 RepID=A0ABM4ADP9_ZIZJJ|nr:lectin 7-like [Ziziphus jujuba]
MALSNPYPYLFNVIIFFLLLITNAESIFFNFASFHRNMVGIQFEGDAFPSNNVLQLTKNQVDGPLTGSIGRASYNKPVKIWDAGTGKLTDFTTHFSFIMKQLDAQIYGDGISFFIAPFDAKLPQNSSGGYLALFSNDTAFNFSSNHIVAVEFDSFKNEWDPSSDHVGININSIISVTNVTWKSSIKNGSIANAWVSYNSTTQNLSVYLTYTENPKFGGESSLLYIVDLRKLLPERVRFGFSAATGEVIEIHNLLSWSFYSTLVDERNLL